MGVTDIKYAGRFGSRLSGRQAGMPRTKEGNRAAGYVESSHVRSCARCFGDSSTPHNALPSRLPPWLLSFLRGVLNPRAETPTAHVLDVDKRGGASASKGRCGRNRAAMENETTPGSHAPLLVA